MLLRGRGISCDLTGAARLRGGIAHLPVFGRAEVVRYASGEASAAAAEIDLVREGAEDRFGVVDAVGRFQLGIILDDADPANVIFAQARTELRQIGDKAHRVQLVDDDPGAVPAGLATCITTFGRGVDHDVDPACDRGLADCRFQIGVRQPEPAAFMAGIHVAAD